eukprot:CAMPEP_0116853842 /NCGR_PEP_ID=MMETSP0418-20121206/18190_1 /TAXON_ID=1158023 /ORGANISM="Astrosyne radiata, Strain 13vi08-1A" /LENGTH=118 /DNA_ID=CAMNT_0004486395 /DNA_START=1 /DNA_END=357 /DNA_ORIENTATION=-
MESQNENQLLSLVNKRMKFWNEETALAEIGTAEPKKSLSIYPVDAPATEALEQFLLFALEETTSPVVEESETQSRSLQVSISSKPSRGLKPTRKPEGISKITGVHEVTRGMARISASS